MVIVARFIFLIEFKMFFYYFQIYLNIKVGV